MYKLKSLLRKTVTVFLSAAIAVTAASFNLSGKNIYAADETSEIHNPIIWADVPDDDVIRVGDTYYMVSTTMFFSPGVPVMKSKDLVSWEICSYVYDTLSDGNKQTLSNGEHDYAHGSWAASLRYNAGTFYVFFGSYGTGKSYIYKTTDIEHGTWTHSEINGVYHDASMLFDDDGRNYLVFGGGGDIKIKELNAEMTDFKWGAQERTLLKTGLTGLSGEGSHIQKINGWYYVFIIAWPNGSGRIELCYRSKDLNGNFEGKTVLNSGVGTYGSGVAQGGIVDTPDGKWYGLLFQDHGSVGRIPVLVPVTWENNWPIMGVNGKAPVTFNIDGGYSGTSLAKSDDFSYDKDKLALEWQWNHNPDNRFWSVTDRSGWLRLTNGIKASNLMYARNTLTQRTEGPSCSSVIKMDVSNMKPGDYAGLSAFQYKYGNVGVYMTDSGAKKIYMSVNGGYSSSSEIKNSYDKIVAEKDLTGSTIYLKASFLYNTVDANFNVSNNIDKANFYYSYDGVSWTKIGDELSMVYDLKMFTGYRSGIYSYATKQTGGYVDIDFFNYEKEEFNTPVNIEPDENGYYFHDTFESDTNKWSGRGAVTIGLSDTDAYAGQNAIMVSDRTDVWNGAQKTISTSVFKPGNEYCFSACYKYTQGEASESFLLTLQYKADDGETHYDHVAQAQALKGEYVQLCNPNYKIPDGAYDVQLVLESETGTMDFYCDEVIGAVAGTKIDGPVPISITPGDINNDGVINIIDVCLIKSVLIGLTDDKTAVLAADTNQDGNVNILDAANLIQYMLGVIPEPEAAK
ncbi:MAG: family 43 glycosylhydrolase [Oscillospiraceae bacterium]|nr:family 43 glycosylhydrolase [Oscillospiraceae bacterium]